MSRSSTRRILVLPAVAALSFLYISAAVVCYQNSRQKELLQTVTDSLVNQSIEESYLHDGDFFRRSADRLQFVQHHPAVVELAYNKALSKSPSDYRPFLSYARYLSARKCCTNTVLSLVSQMTERDPNGPGTNRIAGEILLDLGRKDQAIAYLKKSLELEGSLSPQIYARLENTEDLFRVTPNRITPLLSLGEYLSRRGDSDASSMKKVVEALLGLPLQPADRVRTARLALQARQPQTARNQALLAMQSQQLSALKLLADAAAQEQNWKEYERINTQISALHKESGSKEDACRLEIQMIHQSSQKPEVIIERLKRIINEQPDCTPAYVKIADFYERNSPEVALGYLERAVAVAPQDFRANNRLAELYIKLSKTNQAEKIYERFLTTSFSSQAYLGLARCKQEEGQTRSAILILQKGIQKGPNAKELWRELGRKYAQIGFLDKAAESYLRYASLMQDKPDGFLLAGDAYRKMGELEAARKQYQQALIIDPKNARATESLAALNSGR